MRRAVCAVALALAGILFFSGCRSHLNRTWSFDEFEQHAHRLDTEFEQFHQDVKSVFFGIEDAPDTPIWLIYR